MLSDCEIYSNSTKHAIAIQNGGSAAVPRLLSVEPSETKRVVLQTLYADRLRKWDDKFRTSSFTLSGTKQGRLHQSGADNPPADEQIAPPDRPQMRAALAATTPSDRYVYRVPIGSEGGCIYLIFPSGQRPSNPSQPVYGPSTVPMCEQWINDQTLRDQE